MIAHREVGIILGLCALVYFALFSLSLMFDHVHDKSEINRLKVVCHTQEGPLH